MIATKENFLIKIANKEPNAYFIKQFNVFGKVNSLIYRHKEIVVPKQEQKSLVEWYNNVQWHPVKIRIE